MSKSSTEAKFDEYEAKIRKEWGKLTDDDIQQARGSRDELIAKIQKKYAESRDAISEKLDEITS
ncbi:MAG: CsbD family protein [Wenzhouxiangellaceae bacterium]|nr:CsbD family protein [Wenzhouxiangellaceae bacterium]